MKNDLEHIDGLGANGAELLSHIGIRSAQELQGQNPDLLFEKICRKTELNHDVTLKDKLKRAIAFVESLPSKVKSRKRKPQLLS